MSIRTVIEINHDYLGRIDAGDLEDLLMDLKLVTWNAELNRDEMPEPCPGIRIIDQRHHSEPTRLVIEGPGRRERTL